MRGVGGQESDTVGQTTGVFDQVIAQGGELFDDDPLGGFSQCHIDQGGAFEVDLIRSETLPWIRFQGDWSEVRAR